MIRRFALALGAASLLTFASPARADRPDPSIAVLLSAASTVVPLGGAAILFFTGSGYHEAIRVDLGMALAAIGTLLGPSIGQIYAHGGTDAWVTFFLRGITGTVFLIGTDYALVSEDGGSGQAAGRTVAIIAGIPTGLLALYDIVTAGSNAASYSRRSQYAPGEGPSASESLDPFLRPAPQIGLSLVPELAPPSIDLPFLSRPLTLRAGL
jgi:hypothetical protein